MLHRKLRTSKDEIIDRVLMPFLTKKTYTQALIEPSGHTPRIAIATYKQIAAHYNVDATKYIIATHEDNKPQSSNNNAINASSKEMLVAYNMIS